MQEQDEIFWETHEHQHIPKLPDWHWTVGLVAFAVFAISLYYGNYLFGIFALIAGFTMIMYKVRGPEKVSIGLTPQGIVIKDTLYPYDHIESFCIYEYHPDSGKWDELSIKSKRLVMPKITVPIGETDAQIIRKYLSQRVKEIQHEKDVAEIISELIGF